MTNVLIGRRALQDGELLSDRDDRRRVAMLVQPSITGIADSITTRLREDGLEVHVRELPDGEAAKTIEVASESYQWLNDIGLTRYDTLVAVGGGAATDLAGFVGATYLRGIETVYFPTTLLGALDAAIGGKTGINVDGKNLVGVFSSPERVIIDVDVMSALPDVLLREGFAEALKAGCVGDLRLIDIFEDHGADAPLEEVIQLAVSVKQAVVDEDFREEGQRMILNYGHTVGHAVEVVAGLSHGEAVAIGMAAAGAIAESEVGFSGADRQRTLLNRLSLPCTAPPQTSREKVMTLIGLDKKRDQRGLRMVLLEDFAKPVVVHVSSASLEAGLTAIGIP